MKKFSAPARAGKHRLSRRDNPYIGLLYTLPFLIGFVVIFLNIFITAIRFAFSDMSPGTGGFELTFVGLEKINYALRVDPTYTSVLQNSVRSLLTTIPVVLIFSLFVAVVLNRRLPGRTAFRAIFFLPVIVSTGLISKLDMNNAVMTAMNSSAAIDTGAEAATGAMTALGDVTLFLQSMISAPR